MVKIQDFQVIVVGAGHAGCEAALASARAGVSTLLLTMNLDMVAALPCNPSIGGQGKGQLVREVDALGGEMGIVADETNIQMRRLNTRKGIAVQSNRFQSDKELYSHRMLQSLLACPKLSVLQGMVVGLLFDNDRLVGVKTAAGESIKSQAVILTTGTFLRGMIHIGSVSFGAGRAGEPPAAELGHFLQDYGFPLRRFKTGTPPRIAAATIDFSQLEQQADDDEAPPFSLWSDLSNPFPRCPCHITRTTEDTHRIIVENMHRSALVTGQITGTGPRYCPSIEDKVNKFPDKRSHKVFLEPEDAAGLEVYLQGLSSSLPEDVQDKYVATLPGLENARITRPGYGIEYDVIDPCDLYPTMMSKSVDNLYLAGQINGTSGYEEAAAQGILAAINAVARITGKPSLLLSPQNSYIGLMVSDITTQQISEPYRVFTSRSPFRLQLRMSNAEERLSKIGFKHGIINEERYEQICRRLNNYNAKIDLLESTSLTTEVALGRFPELAVAAGAARISLAQMLKRPKVRLSQLKEFLPELGELDAIGSIEVEARIKYAGYLVQQQKEFDLRESMREVHLEDDFFDELPKVISKEARAKILAARPSTLGELSVLPGVRASDFVVILMKVKRDQKK